MILGLALCEDVTSDAANGNVSVIRAFSGFAMESFPCVAPTFCAFAALTAGWGDATFRLTVQRFTENAELEEVHAVDGMMHFLDPLHTVYWVMRLSRCLFPDEGEYIFTLWIDGNWMAHHRMRVYLKES
jgi:hypothetical protein